MMSEIQDNVTRLRQRIQAVCEECGVAVETVTLLAVSKTQPAARIAEAVAAGIGAVGENYAQEGVEKVAQLADDRFEWHFIGPLQSNKTAEVAAHFRWVQSVDRLKVAKRLAAQRPPASGPLNICLQVNIDREPSKSGVLPEEVPALMAALMELPNLAVRGMMAIPQATTESRVRRASFARLRELFQRERERWPQLDTLSMGMSRDFEDAIREGSTLVRIGTDIFGQRQ